MNGRYTFISDMFRKAINDSVTSDDIKIALDYYFDACDDLKIPIEIQWRCIGIILDQYRKGEL